MAVRRRAARIVLHLDLELTAGAEPLRADTQDVTPFGLFVRLETPLPVGTALEVAIVRDGKRVCVILAGVDGELCHRARDMRPATP